MFEKKEEEEQRQSPQIGKLNTRELFTNNNEDKGIKLKMFLGLHLVLDVKFYKPSIQPKKMKILNPFPEQEDFQSTQELLIFVLKLVASLGGRTRPSIK